MSQSNVIPSVTPSQSFDLDEFERRVRCSPSVACGLIFGLPALGVVVALAAALPLFAALMGGCFLFATTLICRKALATFTGRTLRLLVTARLVIVLVLGALLLCTSGNAWVAVASAVLIWHSADRLLGRRALRDLWALTRSQPEKPSPVPTHNGEEVQCS